MPERTTIARAHKKARQGKAPSTQAGVKIPPNPLKKASSSRKKKTTAGLRAAGMKAAQTRQMRAH